MDAVFCLFSARKTCYAVRRSDVRAFREISQPCYFAVARRLTDYAHRDICCSMCHVSNEDALKRALRHAVRVCFEFVLTSCLGSSAGTTAFVAIELSASCSHPERLRVPAGQRES